MKIVIKLSLVVCVLAVSSAQGQDRNWSDEENAVWMVVKESWAAQAAEDGKWPAYFTHDSFIQWADNVAAPRDRQAYIAWQRESDVAVDTKSHEITPYALTIEGDTAVVTYLAEMELEYTDGEVDSVTRNIFEVLIRNEGKWQYLASTDFTPNHEE